MAAYCLCFVFFYILFIIFLYFETQNLRKSLTEIADSVRYAAKSLAHRGTERNMRGPFTVWWIIKIHCLLKIQKKKVGY